MSVDITPRSISFLMISPALTPMLRASSATVTPSVIRTTRLEALGVVISVLRCSLPGIARRFLGTRSPRISRSAVKSVAPFLTTRFFLIVRAPGLAAPSPGGGITPWSGCGAGGAAGAKREGWPGRGGAAGPGHRSRRTRRRFAQIDLAQHSRPALAVVERRRRGMRRAGEIDGASGGLRARLADTPHARSRPTAASAASPAACLAAAGAAARR